jgi:ABC-type phosphate transport system auxiliary subunit
MPLRRRPAATLARYRRERAELVRSYIRLKEQLDSLSEMEEMEALKLQRAMDRLSKMMSTLSNLLKKASETAQGITQNIK